MEAIITKKNKIHEVKNDMCWNFYYVVYVKFINAEKTKYKKTKFVIWFDIFDIQEYYENEKGITKEQFKDYSDELAYNFIEGINYNNLNDNIEKFRETILNYNRILR